MCSGLHLAPAGSARFTSDPDLTFPARPQSGARGRCDALDIAAEQSARGGWQLRVARGGGRARRRRWARDDVGARGWCEITAAIFIGTPALLLLCLSHSVGCVPPQSR